MKFSVINEVGIERLRFHSATKCVEVAHDSAGLRVSGLRGFSLECCGP